MAASSSIPASGGRSEGRLEGHYRLQVVSDGQAAWLVKFSGERNAQFMRKKTAEDFALAWAVANAPCDVEVFNADGSLQYSRRFTAE
jgi:hypothetical protein